MDHKLFLGPLRVVKVPEGHARSTNVYDARYPWLAVLHRLVVQNVHRLVSQRSAVRDAAPPVVRRVPTLPYLKHVRPDCRFRSTPKAYHTNPRRVCAHCMNSTGQRRGNPIPAHHYHTQRFRNRAMVLLAIVYD